jgi:hypothetical protein
MVERREIGHFSLAEHLQSLANKPVYVSGERETRARDFRTGKDAVESSAIAEVLELKRGSAALEELADGD